MGVGATIAISLAVNAGLGTRIAILGQDQIETIEKVNYAKQRELVTLYLRMVVLMGPLFSQHYYAFSILYLLTLAVAKGSVLLFMIRLVVKKEHSIAVKALTVVVTVWTIVSIFFVAFQCSAPRTWDILGGRCFNSVSKKPVGACDNYLRCKQDFFVGRNRSV